MLILFACGFITSLKTIDDFNNNKVGFPTDGWAWKNYVTVFNSFQVKINNQTVGRVTITFWGMITNTLLYGVGSAFFATLAHCIVAYLVAKFDCALSKIVYTTVIVTMVIPIVGSTPANLLLLHNTNLFDTWLGNYIMKFNFIIAHLSILLF